MKNWTLEPLDEQIAGEIQAALPPRLFDAHAHIYRVADMRPEADGILVEGPDDVGVSQWRDSMERQVGAGRLCGGLLFPVPFVPEGGNDRANDYLFEQVAEDPMLKGLALVAPDSLPETYEALLADPHFAGFKCYHTYSPVNPTFSAPISSFLPEWVWRMADKHGLSIMLHMVRAAALSDPDNQREISDLCSRHPNARLVLAHAARGFHAPNTVRGVSALRGLQNVWFDSSAIAEPEAFKAILGEFGPRRLMWGSDFPVSETRGKCVTVGHGFAWLQPDTVEWEHPINAGQAHPVLVGLESLRALLTACDDFCLNGEDLQDVFADNALRLLGLSDETADITQTTYARAKERIPGGVQLLSKRPEMTAPGQWPAYFREARGCEVWDLDGRHYYDCYTHGIGAALLGFRDPDVTRAVRRRLELGSYSTLNSVDEVTLAETLCDIHPWASQVRYARTGGEAMAVAVRIARATTGRSAVAVCGYHGWHDWYLAANLGDTDALDGHLLPGLNPSGVPRELRGTCHTFGAGDLARLEAIVSAHGANLAAIVMEPCRYVLPEPGFLDAVRDVASRAGAVLIFDEITIGWRLHYGGAHLQLGVHPDIAVFAKSLGNGHPMAAVIGTVEAMEGAHTSFISSTYWTEGIGPAAALATLQKMAAVDVPAHVARVGTAFQCALRDAAKRHAVPLVVKDSFPCLVSMAFEHVQANALRTLYTQYMLEEGILAGMGIYPCLAHTDDVVAIFAEALDRVFPKLAEAIADDTIKQRLDGPEAQSGFARLAR